MRQAGKIVPGIRLDATSVEADFASEFIQRRECIWISEEQARTFESNVYTFFPHPDGLAKCFRVITLEPRATIEFLMVAPDQKLDFLIGQASPF